MVENKANVGAEASQIMRSLVCLFILKTSGSVGGFSAGKWCDGPDLHFKKILVAVCSSMLWKDVSFQIARPLLRAVAFSWEGIVFCSLWDNQEATRLMPKKKRITGLKFNLGMTIYFIWKQSLIFGYKQFLIVLKMKW